MELFCEDRLDEKTAQIEAWKEYWSRESIKDRVKGDLNFWLAHENHFQSEGIEHYFDWCDKIRKIDDEKANHFEALMNAALTASHNYRKGKIDWPEYRDIINGWTREALLFNDRMKSGGLL